MNQSISWLDRAEACFGWPSNKVTGVLGMGVSARSDVAWDVLAKPCFGRLENGFNRETFLSEVLDFLSLLEGLQRDGS